MFDYEKAKFFGDVKQVKTLLSELESFINNNFQNSVIAATKLKKLLKDYDKTANLYNQIIKTLWKQIDPPDLKPEDVLKNLRIKPLIFIKELKTHS